MNNADKLNSLIRMTLVASLTLGLAPFVPEPHIWGKIRWIWGGAVGMQGMDWFDFFLHGTPWFAFIGLTIFKAARFGFARS